LGTGINRGQYSWILVLGALLGIVLTLLRPLGHNCPRASLHSYNCQLKQRAQCPARTTQKIIYKKNGGWRQNNQWVIIAPLCPLHSYNCQLKLVAQCHVTRVSMTKEVTQADESLVNSP